MNRQQRREAAKMLAKLEKNSDENNISEVMSEMESLIKEASFEDLMKIDEIIMTKYLTS